MMPYLDYTWPDFFGRTFFAVLGAGGGLGFVAFLKDMAKYGTPPRQRFLMHALVLVAVIAWCGLVFTMDENTFPHHDAPKAQAHRATCE